MNPAENSSLASPTAPQGSKPHRLIKLGVDVHLREYVVARQIDGTAPQPAQRFSPEGFVAWAAKQVQQADVVHCCYEAGPFGFGLHRQLLRLGVRSIVVRPRNWDEYGKKVKTDRRDAPALVSCLDRFVAATPRRSRASASPPRPRNSPAASAVNASKCWRTASAWPPKA